MAITSTEVQNLIGAQMGLFGMSTTYGQQVSQNVGTGGPQQFAQFGAGAVMDPRAPQDLQLGAQFGMGVARAGVGAANVGVGALSMAGMLGFAPRAFDPFTGTIGAIGRGYQGGMAAGGAGAGIARGLGMGGLAMGGYMAAGSALNWASNQVLQGAQEGLQINAMLSQQATRGNMPGMGGITQPWQAAGVTSMLRGMAGPDAGVGDLTSMMGAGLQGGMFRDVGSMQQFRSRFGELKNSVQQIVQTLQMTQQEGLALMQQMQGMGFHGAGAAGAAGVKLGGLARGLGMDPMSLAGAAGGGAQMARRLGMQGAFGAQMAMGMSGRLGGGMFSDAALSEASGGLPASMAGPALGGQFANAAMRFTSTKPGFRLMGALMDPETGQLDPARVSAFQMNEYSTRQISSMARRNLSKRGVRAALGARHGSLSQELLGELGPEGLIGGVVQSRLQGRGLRPGENMADVSSMMIQQATGLGEQQAGMIQQLITASPGMKQAAEQKIRDSVAEQRRQHQVQQMYSLEGIKRRIVDAYVEPIKAPLRNLGASITNWGQDVFGGAVDWMLGGARPGPQGPSQITPLGAAIFEGSSGGGGGLGGPGGFSMGGQNFSMGGPAPIGGPAGLVGDYFGLQGQYNPQITMGLSAATLGGMALRGPSGRLMSSAPGAVVRGFGGDLLSRQGIRRAAGGLISGAGRLGAGGAGRMLPWVGGALLAGDVAMNVIPQGARNLGLSPDYSGGISGEGGQALHSLYEGGYFRDIAGYSPSGARPSPGSMPVDIGQSAMSTWQSQGGGVFQVQAAPLPGILKESFQAMADPAGFLSRRRDVTQDEVVAMQQRWAQERVHIAGTAHARGGGPVEYARNLTNIIGGGLGGRIGERDLPGQLALLQAVAPGEAKELAAMTQTLLGGATTTRMGLDLRDEATGRFVTGLESPFAVGGRGATGGTARGMLAAGPTASGLTADHRKSAEEITQLVDNNTLIGQALLGIGEVGIPSDARSLTPAQRDKVTNLVHALDAQYSELSPGLRQNLASWTTGALGTGRPRDIEEGRQRLSQLAEGAQFLAAEQRDLVGERVHVRAAALSQRITHLKGSSIGAMLTREAAGGEWGTIIGAMENLQVGTRQWAMNLQNPSFNPKDAAHTARKSVENLIDAAMVLPEDDRALVAAGIGGVGGGGIMEGARIAKALKGRGGVRALERVLAPYEGAAEFFTAKRRKELTERGAPTVPELGMLMKIVDPHGILKPTERTKTADHLADIISRDVGEATRTELGHTLGGLAATGGASIKGTAGGGGGRGGGVVLKQFTDRMSILLGQVDGVIDKAKKVISPGT